MLRVILAIASTAAGLILLLSFKTHGTSAITAPPAAISSPTTPAGGSASTPGTSQPSPSTSSSSPGRSAATSATVTGAAADTMYGPVQVQITVRNGKITAAQAVEYPQGTPRDVQINAYAIPALNQETVAAGSARIDMVSGATYTSNGYATSLQSALDKAGR
jgi:uncharacterized protein with FMN-binding domain